ncbi:hypothetical protein EYF80_059586 [Liparis tanakae]|uniref:Uncharacterized protein n=1 Tax=Liparis tanakae TaxID=230148 RepID=A0A4Z2EPK9_9TELE|nr:hypothetical protein EYF80_059586 [Liparis tanakae]
MAHLEQEVSPRMPRPPPCTTAAAGGQEVAPHRAALRCDVPGGIAWRVRVGGRRPVRGGGVQAADSPTRRGGVGPGRRIRPPKTTQTGRRAPPPRGAVSHAPPPPGGRSPRGGGRGVGARPTPSALFKVYVSKGRSARRRPSSSSPPRPRSPRLLAPVVLVRLAEGFVEALAGPSAVGGPVVRVRGRSGRPPPVGGGGGRAVAVGHPARMRVGGLRGPLAGSPGGARVRVGGPPVRVRVAVGEALLVGGGLVVPLVLVVALVEGPVPLRAVPGRGSAPAAPVGRPGRAMGGRARGLVPGRARRAVPGRGAPGVGRGLARRGPLVVTPVVVRRGEVAGRGRAQPAGPRGAVARLADGGGVGDVGAGHGGGLGQLAAASPRGAGPRAHLSVSPSVGPLAGRAGPVAVLGGPVGVLVPVGPVALLVHGAVVVVVVVVVVPAVLGPAAVPLAFLRREVARLRRGAEVCTQTWGEVSVYTRTHEGQSDQGTGPQIDFYTTRGGGWRAARRSERLTRVGVGVSGEGALRRPVTAVPVPAPAAVPPLLGHHPLQGVVVQPHAAARAPVHQAGGGATHGAGVGDGLRGDGGRCRKETRRRGDEETRRRGGKKKQRK